jgi:meso-butanediol dehydrogenase/(S,S)-butanediol dehydrogenase/diacetyl reductase
MDVTDKVAIVTGAGRGIGRGIALALAENGADVVVGDINLDNARKVAAEVAEMGRKSLALHLDVTNQESVDQMVKDTLARFGRIDILVNNAGVIGAPGWEQRERHNEEDWNLIYEVNVKGVARVTDAVSPHMKARRYGKIINIASHGGRRGGAGISPYGISKAGVIHLTQSSALELAPYNINVNSICPGTLWTDMWQRIAVRTSLSAQNSEGLTPREIFDRSIQQRMPLGREQTPEDIGYMAAFLASDYAKNITGQAINVNGGAVMN